MKKWIAFLLCTVMCLGLVACGAKTDTTTTGTTTASVTTGNTTEGTTKSAAVTGSVTAAGSSALLPLAQAAAETFMANNPDCSVTVNGGGSGEGLKQVSAATVDIGNSDVFAEQKLDASSAAALVDHEVCTVTMAAVVNASLNISNLTTQQLTDIFTAKVTNWKDVGGPDLDILLVTRPSSSGTRALFKTWAMNGAEEASNQALETDDSGTLLQTVAENQGAIGYVALSYLVNNSTVKALSLNNVAPTLENTYNGTYPVWGFEHMYTNGNGSAAAQAFINYMTGSDFSSKLEAMGYGVASKMSSTAVSSHK